MIAANTITELIANVQFLYPEFIAAAGENRYVTMIFVRHVCIALVGSIKISLHTSRTSEEWSAAQKVVNAVKLQILMGKAIACPASKAPVLGQQVSIIILQRIFIAVMLIKQA